MWYPLTQVDFLRHDDGVQGYETERPQIGLPIWGPMHLWRTVDPDIPCQVASPQSLTPFLRALSL